VAGTVSVSRSSSARTGLDTGLCRESRGSAAAYLKPRGGLGLTYGDAAHTGSVCNRSRPNNANRSG